MRLNLSILATLFRTELRMVLRDRRIIVAAILLPLLNSAADCFSGRIGA